MISKGNSRRNVDFVFLALLLAGVAVRIGYLVYYRSMPEWDQLTVDNYYYHHLAQSVAGGNILGDTTYFRAPLYVWSLGACYAVFGDSLWVARAFGLAIGLGSLSLTYLIARRLFDRSTALVAVAIQSLCPIIIHFESEILLDPLFMVLLQCTIYRLLVWLDKRSNMNLFWSGLILGLSAIARPTSLPLALLLVVLPLILLANRREALLQIAAAMLGVAVFVLPVTARNLAKADDPVLIASQGGINFYIGNHAGADGLSATLPEPLGYNWRMSEITSIAESAAGHPLKPGEISAYWTGQALNWIESNPGQAIRLYLKKLYFSFSNRELSNNRNLDEFFSAVPFFKYNPITFAPLFGLALIGFLLTVGASRAVRVLAVVVIALILIDALFFVNSRFRLPIVPLLIVTASYSLVRIVTALRNHSWRLFAISCSAAILVGCLSRIEFISLPMGSRAQSFNSKALYYYTQRDDRQALSFAQMAVQADTTFPEANLNFGNIWLRTNQPDSAEYYYSREIRLHPLRDKAYTNLASLEFLEHRLDSASYLVRRSLDLQPSDPVANALAIRIDFARSQDPDSLLAFVASAVKRSHADLKVLTEAAGTFTQINRLDDALPLLAQAIAAHRPAIETDDAAFDRDFPDTPDRFERRKATAYYLLGFIYGKSGRFDDAAEASRQAIARDSGFAEAYINLVSAYLSSEKLSLAEQTLTVAQTRFPQNSQLRQLAQALTTMKKDRE